MYPHDLIDKNRFYCDTLDLIDTNSLLHSTFICLDWYIKEIVTYSPTHTIPKPSLMIYVKITTYCYVNIGAFSAERYIYDEYAMITVNI